MFGIGLPELIIILVVAFLLIGPKDMPKLARDFGKVVKNVRRTAEDFKDDIQREIDKTELEAPDEPERKIDPPKGP